MPLKVNLAHYPFHAFGGVLDLDHVLPQDPPGHVLLRDRAASCQATPWPSSSNRCAEGFGYSIRG
jgi:hypothetical protein